MGILDSKSRILDTVVTEEGRHQMAYGELNIKFAAFSDKFTFYESDLISGSTDASERIYFEAASLPQDRVTFEADDSGKLMSFEKEGWIGVYNGKVISGSTVANKSVVTGTNFASLSGILLSGSSENFSKLRVIGSTDLFRDTGNFVTNPKQITFDFNENAPIPSNAVQNICVNDVESLFQDKRLSHIPNFKFLPPINKPNVVEPKGSPLGTFIPIGQEGFVPFSSDEEIREMSKVRSEFRVLLNELEGVESGTVRFSETSRENNIFAQFFEIRDKDVLKLDVIDFGSFPSEDASFPDPHVFFVGKVFLDDVGRHTFVNIFTLIFT